MRICMSMSLHMHEFFFAGTHARVDGLVFQISICDFAQSLVMYDASAKSTVIVDDFEGVRFPPSTTHVND